MKKQLFALALAAAVPAVPALAATNIGVSIGINQPGVYGRVDIGNYPQPVLVNPQPVIVAPPMVAVPRQPIYLYVPLAYQQNWPRYCMRYNACNQPVYFVQEQWVRDRYAQEHPGWRPARPLPPPPPHPRPGYGGDGHPHHRDDGRPGPGGPGYGYDRR